MNLDQMSLSHLKGVGEKMLEKLQRLQLATVQDLLFHLPLRYEDRTQIYPIAQLMPGMQVSLLAEVVDSHISYGRKRMLLCRIRDASGSLTLRFFNFGAMQTNNLTAGTAIWVFGEVRPGQHGLEIIHPEYRLQHAEQPPAVETHLTPIYSTTEGLRQITLRQLVQQALALLSQHPLTEWLPQGSHTLSLEQAVQLLHRPLAVDSEALILGKHPAQQRLIMEELLAHNLSVLQVREQGQAHHARALRYPEALINDFLAQLPFTPTSAQQRVAAEINADLQNNLPMMRLVQGDVGSGKTLVAALAALQVIGNQGQVALMAPTELLAEQHANNFAAWLNPLGIKVGWLAGKVKGKARTEQLERLASGELGMIVGTHALFQEQVKFNALELVVIDEQHRFGVHQRLALREKGSEGDVYPHQLIMTATPIPRTLAMTAYADLDTSVIDELPPGRTPVTTVAMPDTRRAEIIARVREVCREQGRQAYWVCTLIEESEVLECQAAEDTATELTAQLPELNIGLVHGRMKAEQKQAVMADFKDGKLDLLVATTVIEVGVDVPNASLMIIENPERLGLAQLHQLRGRVGRGAIASHCVLLYHAPLSKTASQRLGVLRDTNDGFIIAQKDLEIRGPGELLGTRQTGLANLKVADLVRDQYLLPDVQRLAREVMDNQPQAVGPLIQRWLGERDHYGAV